MGYSDEDIKRIASLREWLDNMIKDKEIELDNLKYTLSLIDNLLKTSSFKPAAVLSEEPEVRQLKGKDGRVLANVYISTNTITIVPLSDLKLTQQIPPFQSFFISRILEGMRSKDMEKVKEGLPKDEILEYKIEEEGEHIKSIIIKNYRDKNRLKEILNASEWALARMVEKVR